MRTQSDLLCPYTLFKEEEHWRHYILHTDGKAGQWMHPRSVALDTLLALYK